MSNIQLCKQFWIDVIENGVKQLYLLMFNVYLLKVHSSRSIDRQRIVIEAVSCRSNPFHTVWVEIDTQVYDKKGTAIIAGNNVTVTNNFGKITNS